MRKTNKVFTGFLLVSFLLMQTFTGSTQFLRGKKWWKDAEVIKKLSLTPQQIDELEKIWVENKKQLVALKADLDKQFEILHELFSQASVDESQLKEQIYRTVAARTKLMTANLLRITKMRKILTSEQRAKVAQVNKEMREAEQAEKQKPKQPSP